MKKTCLVICLLSLLMLLLCACTADFSATESDLLPEELSQPQAFDIFAQRFSVTDSKHDLGGRIVGMRGQFGCFETQTPSRVMFCYQTDSMNAGMLLAYDKANGTFSHACPDALCAHENCLFNGSYKIFAGERHLFFLPLFGGDGKAQYYTCTDTDGNGLKQLSLTTDCELLCETEKGLYYSQTTLDGETYKTALWLYDFASETNAKLTEDGELWYFYVLDGTVYLHDSLSLTLSVFSDDLTERNVLAEGVTAVYPFDGALYLHDTQANMLDKVSGGTVSHAFDTRGIEFETWCVSGGYLYYTCRDDAFIESQKGDAKLYKYLNTYNLSCGRIYRKAEGASDAESVYAGTHGGIPDQIQNFFADGNVLYIEYRDYKSFKNNYNTERRHAGIVIADADTGAFLDIPGR